MFYLGQLRLEEFCVLARSVEGVQNGQEGPFATLERFGHYNSLDE